jgi:carbonic anhydrase
VAPLRPAGSPAHTLELLKEGNARFVSGDTKAEHPTIRSIEHLREHRPYAIVLGCSDARVPIDVVFDTVPGHIFNVRVAGNVAGKTALGSIEFAVAVLRAPLIVVLGHTQCGAVGATVKFLENGVPQPGYIQDLVTAVAPAAESARALPGDWTSNAIDENVRANVRAVSSRSSIVGEALRAEKVAIAGAVYNLHTGEVRWL